MGTGIGVVGLFEDEEPFGGSLRRHIRHPLTHVPADVQRVRVKEATAAQNQSLVFQLNSAREYVSSKRVKEVPTPEADCGQV